MSRPLFRTFRADYAQGTANEHQRIADIAAHYAVTFKKSDDPFAPFDYHTADRTVYAELKTRNIRHDEHPTALIGHNKVDFATMTKNKSPDTKFYFIWEYSDGVYALEYDAERWMDYERALFQRHARTDHTDRPSVVVHIPHQHLSRIL